MIEDAKYMFDKDDLALRILAGTNIFFAGVGAIAEFFSNNEHKDEFAVTYELVIQSILDSLDWQSTKIYKKLYRSGVILAIPTEIDLTEIGLKILSLAFDIATAKYNKSPEIDFAEKVLGLKSIVIKATNLNLRAIYNQAKKRNLNFYLDDNQKITVGSGKYSYSADVDQILAHDIPWDEIHEIPSVMITGTNGKTTTVRLTSFISKNAGKIVGYCSTEWVMIDEEIIEEGDLSGPYGNQIVMCDKTVEVAVLEVARGGITKRGLSTSHVNAAVVLNISEDHIGQNGIETVFDLASAKFTVQNTVVPSGYHVINLDDTISHSFIAKISGAKAYFSQKLTELEIMQFLVTKEDYACFIEDGTFVVFRHGCKNYITKVSAVDLTYNGIAKHNVENVLAAICLSIELGRTYAEIAAGLLAFKNDKYNPGRFNIFQIKGYQTTKILLDYGHNLVSINNILQFARSIANPDTKITLLIGFTGDRKMIVDDVAKSVIKHNIDFVIIKLFNTYLRGAEVGELAKLFRARLLKNGFSENKILADVDLEIEALNMIFSNIEENHIYIMLCHEDIMAVTDAINNYNLKISPSI